MPHESADSRTSHSNPTSEEPQSESSTRSSQRSSPPTSSRTPERLRLYPTAIRRIATSLPLLLLLLAASASDAAPAHCRACKDCPNPAVDHHSISMITNVTDADLLDLLEPINASNRTKRAAMAGGDGVEIRSCSSFPIELILIPIAIALIPLGLCALLCCTCYCGPEESRGKMPENVLGTLRRSASSATHDEIELEYKDGYVQRKDSKMTKFSTTVDYIEPPERRQSVWSTGASLPSSPIHKSPSCDSLKRTRFSDTVHVSDGDSTRLGPPGV